MKELPKFLTDKINSPPAAGGGVHAWIFDVARNLHAHMPVGQIEALIRSKLVNCGRPVPDREIKAAIADSVKMAWEPKGGVNVKPPPTGPNLADIEWKIEHGKRAADLFHDSRYRFDWYDTEHHIDFLFPNNPLLCCGVSAMVFETKSRAEWRGQLERQSFIVPSPMSAATGLTQDGKPSAHSLNNTGPRRFLVVEFDFSEKDKSGKETIWAPMIRRFVPHGTSVQDMCAALLYALDAILPMTLAVSSGGKSIHGWWFCAGLEESKLAAFWNRALALGADPRTWLRSQFIRMPDGSRNDTTRQPVLYFNPATLITP